MTDYALRRLADGLPMSGLFEVPRASAIREIIDDIVLLTECSLPDEWVGQIRYLPLL